MTGEDYSRFKAVAFAVSPIDEKKQFNGMAMTEGAINSLNVRSGTRLSSKTPKTIESRPNKALLVDGKQGWSVECSGEGGGRLLQDSRTIQTEEGNDEKKKAPRSAWFEKLLEELPRAGGVSDLFF